MRNKAHIIGPSIAGAPNNYYDLDLPWQDWLIGQAGLLNHPYSFDTMEQMKQYYGENNSVVNPSEQFEPPYFDGLFTNRSEMTLNYLIENGVRANGASVIVPDAKSVLDKLGY